MDYQQSLDAGGNLPSLAPTEVVDDGFANLQSLTEDVGSVSYRAPSLPDLD
jgi:hypothetical protein